MRLNMLCFWSVLGGSTWVGRAKHHFHTVFLNCRCWAIPKAAITQASPPMLFVRYKNIRDTLPVQKRNNGAAFEGTPLCLEEIDVAEATAWRAASIPDPDLATPLAARVAAIGGSRGPQCDPGVEGATREATRRCRRAREHLKTTTAQHSEANRGIYHVYIFMYMYSMHAPICISTYEYFHVGHALISHTSTIILLPIMHAYCNT